MKLDVRDLELVQAVAATGSLTAAARHIGLTPSALSYQLKTLEERTRTALFLRVGKRMVLTEPGERLLASADAVTSELERASVAIERLATGKAGTLRLSTACYTAYHWLPGLLAAFANRHPELDLRVLPDLTPRAVEALRKGLLDVAIAFGEVADPELVTAPFLDDELVAVVAPGHRFARRAYVEPADFAEEDVALYRADARGSVFLGEVLAPARVSPRSVHAIPLTEAILELVASGRFVTVLASWAAAAARARGAVVTLRLGADGFRRTWRLVAVKGSAAERLLPELAAVLREEATRSLPQAARTRPTRVKRAPTSRAGRA